MRRCAYIIFKKGRFSHCAGYTLIELSVVLALSGLILFIAFPRLTILPYLQLETASRRIASELRLLRQEAITSGQPCKMEFYIHINRYSLFRSEGRKNIELPEGIFFEGNTTFSGKPPTVCFNYLGHPSSGGTIILKAGEQRRYVIVAPVTGRVRISRKPPQHW